MDRHDHDEFLVLTKRPENVRAMVPEDWLRPGAWPRHIRIGATAGTRKSAAERLPHLLEGPWPNFVSAEPLLEPVDFGAWMPICPVCRRRPGTCDHLHPGQPRGIDWLIVGGESGPKARPCDLAWVRQVVAACKAAQVPVFVKQLGAAASDERNGLAGRSLKVPPDAVELVSQRLKHKKGGDLAEWPQDLRDVREFPEVRCG